MTDTSDKKQVSLKKENPLLARMKACGAALARGAASFGRHYLLPILRALKPYAPTLASFAIAAALAPNGPAYTAAATAPALYFTIKQNNTDLPTLAGNLAFGVNLALVVGLAVVGSLSIQFVQNNDSRADNAIFTQTAYKMIAEGSQKGSYTYSYENRAMDRWSFAKKKVEYDAELKGIEEVTALNENGGVYDLLISITKKGQKAETRSIPTLVLFPKSVETGARSNMNSRGRVPADCTPNN